MELNSLSSENIVKDSLLKNLIQHVICTISNDYKNYNDCIAYIRK